MAFSRLWRVFVTHSRASPVDASPVLRVRGGDITTIIACASASCTRDRLAESNQSTRAKHYEHDPYLFARPVRSPSARHAQAPFARAHHRMPAPVIDRSASLEVCGPCNAHWLRSRCPGRPVSGRSRFGVSSSRRPARILSCTCRPRCSRSPLRFSAFSGFIAMKLAWRTLIGSERWNRIRRSRGASPQWGRTRLCRRVDDLLLWPLASSIARAGEIGESDPQRHPPDRHTGRPMIT
jgi:hypothetical protein